MKKLVFFAVLVVCCLSLGVGLAKAQGSQECFEYCGPYGGELRWSIQFDAWQVGCGSGVFCSFGQDSFSCHEFAYAVGEGAQCFYATTGGNFLPDDFQKKESVPVQSVKKSSQLGVIFTALLSLFLW